MIIDVLEPFCSARGECYGHSASKNELRLTVNDIGTLSQIDGLAFLARPFEKWLYSDGYLLINVALRWRKGKGDWES